MENQKKRTPSPKKAKAAIKKARIILIPVLCLLALIIGMIIGYVNIGKGDLSDVFKIDTWSHLLDLVFKD